MSVEREHVRVVATAGDHRVTPAELFFDLVFVYAITQVTALMAAHPTVPRLLGSLVVLALLWWCWCCFAWLGNVVRADTGTLFAVLVTVMAVVLTVSLAVPEVFTDRAGGLPAPLVFALCYGAVRLLHLVTYRIAHPDDRALHATLRKTALVSVAPPLVLLLAGSVFTGRTQMLCWLGAVLIDYTAIYVTGGSGWRIASPGHFAERHGLIVIIALGESIVAIGVGMQGYALNAPVVAAGVAGLLAVAGLWRLYFRRLSEAAEHVMAAADGDARTRIGRDVYTFLHLPLIGGVVLCALGMKTALHQIADTGHYALSEPLHGAPAWALTGGVGVFLLGAAAITARIGARGAPVLLAGGTVCLAGGAVVRLLPALASVGLLAVLITGLVVLYGRLAEASPTSASSPATPSTPSSLAGD
ncbi:hypothetical protein SRB5_15270 [Streptomyces sp. RB5]|uniref:Low temperature requirement protein LtrA n=1 Tax=Streptomyces smaragdinus TaxID=2585196 RepID=A0A7K0CD77_9ACTN|nr:low temperature requirement protein A [Streptomyces smaragdinus]MQY11411.1 hypothetical protein [Streptomyces smaragdinus]